MSVGAIYGLIPSSWASRSWQASNKSTPPLPFRATHILASCQTYHYSFCQRNQRWCDLVVRNQPSIIWEISRWPQRKCPGPRLTIRSKIKPQSHVRLDRLAGVGQKSQTIRQLRSCLFSSHSLISPFAGESHQGISIYREGEIRAFT